MRRRGWLVLAALVPAAALAAEPFGVVDAAWRSDANPFAKKQVWEHFVWAEGWDHAEQFYPKHFEPAGSLHVVLRNRTGAAAKLALTHLDGAAVGGLCTTPDRAGPIVYHWVEPEAVPAGAWTECIVRLRAPRKADVRLTFQPDGAGPFEVVVPARARRVRIEGIAFSSEIDRIYVYLRGLDGAAVGAASLELDGEPAPAETRRLEGPAGSGLVLIESPLRPAWEPGSFHLVQAKLADGTAPAQPIRAWDHFFMIGLWGPHTREKAEAARAHGINTYVSGGPFDALDALGLSYIQVGRAGPGRSHTARRSGRVCYYNLDEPDAHDALQIKSLPLMERLGVNAMRQVIPVVRQQRAADAKTANLVLANNTYKPLNWYVYGQIGDILATDPYVPISAEQLDRVPCSLAVARDACCPHPLVAVLWATANSGHRWCRRPPTPQEERMMAFYALGSGVSGLAYFADLDVEAEGGRFLALSANRDLWEEVGRINRDVGALVPYLSIACPLPDPPANEAVWVRSLMCGPSGMVTVVVNRGHVIGFNTVNHFPFHFPARDVALAVDLPAHLRTCRVREVRDGRLVPIEAQVRDGRALLSLDVVDTARAFVFTP